MSIHRPSCRGLTLLACVLAVFPFLLGQGCPSSGTGGGAGTVTVRSPNLDQSVAVGGQVTMVYDAPGATSVQAFYDHDGQGGGKVVFSSNLPAGTGQVAQLATAGLPLGLYYLGVTASNSAGSTTVYAAGRITLVGSAAITFLSPAADVNVGSGVSVPIRFDAGLTDFTYRLFYDRDATVNSNEVTISQGPSNGTSLIEKPFDTGALTSGTYYVGVTVTTTVGSSTTAYATGKVILTTGVYAQVLAPTIGLQATVGDLVQIVVAANDPANPDVAVRIFYDPDNTFGNDNETTIAVVAASSGGTTWDTTGVAEGTYYIGLELQNGQTPPFTSYSMGPAELVAGTGGGGGGATGVFTLTFPSADVRVYEGAETEIRWIADNSLASGTVALYRVFDRDNTGVLDPSAPLVAISGATALSPALRKYTFNTQGLTGPYFIVGKLTAADNTVYKATARGRLIVRPPLYWVGGLNSTKSFAGCTLRGFNFQDLAGSFTLPTGDVDGDGIDDFMVISQYGKPGLVNPGGVGYGEAYLIYGNRVRLTGAYDLNRTGSKPATNTTFPPPASTPTTGLDQGVIFAGITVPPGSTSTSGITAASLMPDMEGDGKNELIFAIPKADSLSLYNKPGTLTFEGLLEDDQQFLRGGIVIVASTNSLLDTRSAISRDLNRVIRLQEVGQAYYEECSPTANSCTIKPPCLAVEPCHGQIFKDSNGDGNCDTYDYSVWIVGGFSQPSDFWGPVNPPLASRFYTMCPATVPPFVTGMIRGVADREPFGCRILGQALEDGTPPNSLYGTAISTIRSSDGYHLILVSAPNQTAKAVNVPELTADRPSSGVVYALEARFQSNVQGSCYWDPKDTTPMSVARPHQYIVGTGGYDTAYVPRFGSVADMIRRPFYIVGPTYNAQISNVMAIRDFNGDGRDDFVVGSPNENNNAGAVYIIFRRPTELEGNYLLEKLALAPTDPERLNGVMIQGDAGDRMGEVVSPGGDFNGDGIPDVLIGLPNHNGGRGAVLIVFGREDLVSPITGFTVSDVVAQGFGAMLVGANAGDLAGFNVASAGDVDGDGKDDLLIAAPAASPMFDSNGDGTKDAIGMDLNGDGVADDLTNSGQSTDLTNAGLVYLVKGSNAFVGEVSLSLIGTKDLNGLAFVGRAKNDNLGGGTSVLGMGARSRGLATAGDVDKDGKSDILIGSMLASPEGKSQAGECYLIYGGIQP